MPDLSTRLADLARLNEAPAPDSRVISRRRRSHQRLLVAEVAALTALVVGAAVGTVHSFTRDDSRVPATSSVQVEADKAGCSLVPYPDGLHLTDPLPPFAFPQALSRAWVTTHVQRYLDGFSDSEFTGGSARYDTTSGVTVELGRLTTAVGGPFADDCTWVVSATLTSVGPVLPGGRRPGPLRAVTYVNPFTDRAGRADGTELSRAPEEPLVTRLRPVVREHVLRQADQLTAALHGRAVHVRLLQVHSSQLPEGLDDTEGQALRWLLQVTGTFDCTRATCRPGPQVLTFVTAGLDEPVLVTDNVLAEPLDLDALGTPVSLR